MFSLLHKFRARIGDFWWYSLLVFTACRTGDLIQAFIGLWLVPHFVPQSELGAVLPLLQFASFWGLPLSIILIPFTKFLNQYATRGEYGKVKTLLSFVFVAASIVLVITLVFAKFVFPFFFTRIRVAEGSLGILSLVAGLLCTFSPVFNNALQSLKKFNTITLINVLGAPARLIVLLITMPVRALSGYVAGTMAQPILQIFGSLFALRHELGPRVKREPVWRDDGWSMVRYTMPVALNCTVATICAACQTMLIRQCLPEVESAAYYIISRLGEVGTYAGLSLAFVAFPLAAEAKVRGKENLKILRNLLLGTAVPGILLAFVFLCVGGRLFEIVPLWRPYAAYVPQLALLTLNMSVGLTICNFGTYEMAGGRFAWMWYLLPLIVAETGGLAFLTDGGSFATALSAWLSSAFHTSGFYSLNFFLWWFFSFNVIRCAAVLIHVFVVRKRGARVRG